MTATASGGASVVAGFEPGEPVHRDHLDPVAPRLLPFGEPLPEGRLGAALDHVQQPRRPGAATDTGDGCGATRTR